MSLRLILACSFVIGCGTDAMPAGSEPLPDTSGSFVGHYIVPTSPALAAAGTFAIDRVDWMVNAGVVRLDYDLPLGLVGGKLSIELEGPLASGETSATLTSDQGTATCTVADVLVTCSEQLADLGTLPIDLTVIQQRASIEYTGPAADRVQVAQVFGSDPIGSVTFDLSMPSQSGD